MTTKLSVYCDKVIETGWLLAVALIPLFFNVYSNRVFEPDKLTLLRSIALVVVVAWLIKVLEQMNPGPQTGSQADGATAASGREAFRRWLLETPLVLPTLAMVVVYLISTIASVVPGVSLLGSYQRLQGTYTTFSYLILFFMILQGMRRRDQLDRLITAVLISSLSVSLYGIVQHNKLDPLPWGGDTTSRVAANMGNAIFVAAYLIMTLPLALGRLIETLGRIVDWGQSGRSVAFVVGYLVLLLAQLAIWMRFGYMAGIFSGLLLIGIVVLASLFLNRPMVHFALLGAYSFIFSAQTMTIIFSQSRGPWLGLLAGLYIFVLLALTSLRRLATDQSRVTGREVGLAAIFAVLSPLVALAPAYAVMVALRKGTRWLWLSWLMQALFGVAFLVALNLPTTPLAPLRALPYVGRLGDVFETGGGTGAVRVLIWQGVVQMIQPHAPLAFPGGESDTLNFLRPLVGYGPESMYVAYNPFYQPALAQIEARNASPDRSHNETFDSLVITGLLGFVVYLVLFGSVFFYGLRCLGMASQARDRYVYIGFWAVGGLLGAAAAYVLDGSFRFFGVGVPTGCMLGLALYVAIYGLFLYDPEARGDLPEGTRMIVIALLAAVVAHFVEIHFGIAIAASRTSFWVYVGVLVAVGYYFKRESEAAASSPVASPVAVSAPKVEPVKTVSVAETSSRRPPQRKGAKQKSAAKPPPADKSAAPAGPARSTTASYTTASLAAYALLVVAILITMVFDFVTRTFDLRSGNGSIFWLFAITWVLATTVMLAISALNKATGEGTGDWIRGALVYVMVSLGGLAVFALIYSGFIGANVTAQGLAAVMEITTQVNYFLIVYYAAVGIVLFLMAFALYRAVSFSGPAWQYRNWWIYPPLVAVAIYLILTTNIQVILADMVYKQALPYDGRSEYDASIPLYLRAIQLAPTQDFYYLFLGRAYLEKGQRSNNSDERAKYLTNSRDALLKAFDLNPLNTDHSANLARLYRAWGGMTTDVPERIKMLQQSYDYYRQASSLSPQNAQLWNEWGLVAYFLGRYDDAVQKFQHSVALDPAFVDTYVFLGDAYQSLNKPDEALQAHLKAIELNPGSLTDQRFFSLPIPGFLDRRFDFYTKAGKIDPIVEALQKDPQASQDFATTSLLGNIYLRQGNLDKALGLLKQAAVRNPNDLATSVALGYIHAQQGQLDEAEAEFKHSVQIAPNDLTSHRNLAGVLRQMNRLDEARQEFEKAAALAPDDLVTIQALAEVYGLLGLKPESLKQMQRWVEVAPTDYNAHKNLALMYRELGQITEAISETRRAMELAPEDQRPALQKYLTELGG